MSLRSFALECKDRLVDLAASNATVAMCKRKSPRYGEYYELVSERGGRARSVYYVCGKGVVEDSHGQGFEHAYECRQWLGGALLFGLYLSLMGAAPCP
ncbi:MAG: hypothetical protein K6A65_08655 [Succinivibrionaceae bacterium]|nr:hypothetical protein [Succinivibrionaceae bacterium]